MSYQVFLIPPKPLYDEIVAASRRVVKEVYSKEVDGISYRIRERQHNDDDRKLFIPGNGGIHEIVAPPHSTLVLGFDAPKQDEDSLERFIAHLAPKRFSCRLEGIGDHEKKRYTFFIRLSPEKELLRYQHDLQLAFQSRYPMQQTINTYMPHITLFYDDVDEGKATKARTLFGDAAFIGDMLIDRVFLCKDRAPVREIQLNE